MFGRCLLLVFSVFCLSIQNTGVYAETYGAGNWPPGGWFPDFPLSPMLNKVPANPHISPDSDTIVSWLQTYANVQTLGFRGFVVSNSNTTVDSGIPLYWSNATDPLYTLTCSVGGTSCGIYNTTVHIPAGALRETGSDEHLTVFDQSISYVIDMWESAVPNPNGGNLTCAYGGRSAFGGDGLKTQATNAGVSPGTGLVRAADLLGGPDVYPKHILLLTAPCLNDPSVYPADGPSDAVCTTDTRAAHYGDWLYLDMSFAEIEQQHWAPMVKAIAKSLSEYGAIMSDTTNSGPGIGMDFEAKETWTSFGYRNMWLDVAEANGVPTTDTYLDFHLGAIPFNRIRVIDPCEMTDNCTGSSGATQAAYVDYTPVCYSNYTTPLEVLGTYGLVGSYFAYPGNGASVNTTYTTVTYESYPYSIQLNCPSAYGEVGLVTSIGYNTTGYDYLEISVLGSKGSTLSVGVITNGWSPSAVTPSVSNYGPAPNPDTWTLYQIPLSDMAAVNITFNLVLLSSPSSGNYYFGSIYLKSYGDPSSTIGCHSSLSSSVNHGSNSSASDGSNDSSDGTNESEEANFAHCLTSFLF